MVRANTSGLPPGVNGTMMRIGLLGYVGSAHAAEVAKVASASKNVERFIIHLQKLWAECYNDVQ
jgi:hypothetical protein